MSVTDPRNPAELKSLAVDLLAMDYFDGSISEELLRLVQAARARMTEAGSWRSI